MIDRIRSSTISWHARIRKNSFMRLSINKLYGQAFDAIYNNKDIQIQYKYCDQLLQRFHYDELKKLLDISSNNSIIDSYIKLLLEIQASSEERKAFAEDLFDIDNIPNLCRLVCIHPKKLSLKIFRSGRNVIKILEFIKGKVDAKFMANFICEITMVSIELELENEIRDNILNLAMRDKLMSSRYIFIICKSIFSGHISIKPNDKLGRLIINAVDTKTSKDCDFVYKLKNRLSNIEDARMIVSNNKITKKFYNRSIDGEWNECSEDEVVIPINTTMIVAIAWGNKEIYLDSLSSIGYRSLEKSLKMSKEQLRNSYIHIYTTLDSVNDLKNIINKINPKCNVILDTTILGKNDIAIYHRGLTNIDAVSRAVVNNSTIIFLSPDTYYGEGMDKLLDKCPYGGISAAPVLRVSQSKFFEFCNSLKSIEGINNDILSKKAFSGEWYHPYQDLYIRNSTAMFSSYCIANKLILFSWTQCGFVIKPDLKYLQAMITECKPRYNTSLSDNCLQFIDHEAFHILNEKNLAYRAKSTREFILIEPSRDKGYSPYTEKAIAPLAHRSKAYPSLDYTIYL